MTETTFLADLEELEDWLTRINAPVPDIALPTVQRAIAQAKQLAQIWVVIDKIGIWTNDLDHIRAILDASDRETP